MLQVISEYHKTVAEHQKESNKNTVIQNPLKLFVSI